MPGDASDLLIVKVGGSLYGERDLGSRLAHWLKTLSGHHVVLVPGGGRFADLIRDLDGLHCLGEEPSHWLALSALGVAARFLALALPEAVVINGVSECAEHWRYGRLPVLDPLPFARSDEENPDHLPHRWAATSDALAARFAVAAGAKRLILLKSVSLPPGLDWSEAANKGIVDSIFPTVIGTRLSVECVNFGQWRG
jgi:aspartokinase-like uncharacterized kinase